MKLDFDKSDGLIPVIIQHFLTNKVLMLGYMNEVAFHKTTQENIVTFYSRSRQCLWTKGETSNNHLIVKEIREDCDHDTLLIMAEPQGPTCHMGTTSCFNDDSAKGFIYELQGTIADRFTNKKEVSYTQSLIQKGLDRILQKVGEEAVELIIEAKGEDQTRIKEEAADLMYHFLVLLKQKEITFEDIESVLEERHNRTIEKD